MAQVSVWSTEGLPPDRCLEYWNDCAVQALKIPFTVDPANASCFWGRISHIGLERLHLSQLSSDAAVVHHSATQAAKTDGSFHVLVQLSGRSLYRQAGRESALCLGDFLLVDCSLPYQILFNESAAHLVVTINREHLKSYIACPEALAAVKLSGSSGPSALASRLLRELWTRPEELAAGCDSPFLERAVLDVIATAYSTVSVSAANPSSQAMTRRVRLMTYIEQHLYEPELSVTTIAAALRVTTRCVYRLFDGETETLAEYIRRRRIEESARALANAQQRGRSISTIAYDHGFSSIAHFSKVFREHYGKSPTEYRQEKLAS